MSSDGEKYSLDSAEALHDFAAAHNLSEIVNFHNVVRACLSEKASEFADDVVVKSALENYTDYLATATFLMVYSYFEEDLYLLWKWKAKNVQRGKEKSIKRYQPVLAWLGFDLGHSSWQFMLEATDIRHSLLHANGRLDHNPNRQRLDSIVAKYPGELSVMHSRLRVTAEFLSRILEQVRSFQDETKRVGLAQESQNSSE